METDFVELDRGVVYITEKGRRQVVLGVFFLGCLQQCSVLFIKTTYSREP